MEVLPEVQSPPVAAQESEAAEPWLWSAASPQAEARLLFSMIGRNGDSLESIRELISVPPHVETLLRAFAQEHPEHGAGIEGILRYRLEVGREFERLVR